MPPTNIKQIGKYPVLEIISRGGMGVVFKATDPSLHRPVAIKMIRAFEDNPDLLKRFYQEAQSTGNLHHPNIETVYDMGEHEGNPYIVMRWGVPNPDQGLEAHTPRLPADQTITVESPQA